MLQKYKADTSSRLQEQKRIEERRRNILVIIYRHLIQCGYSEAAGQMGRECNIDLDKWEIADNIDLYYMIQDFEEYFEMKFMKKPVLVKKAPENEMDFRKKRGLPPVKAGHGVKGGSGVGRGYESSGQSSTPSSKTTASRGGPGMKR